MRTLIARLFADRTKAAWKPGTPAFAFTPDALISDLPFTHLNAPEGETLEAWKAQLSDAGVRLYPPPFDQCMAIFSDIDGTSRESADLCHRQFIRTFGLDYGDSAWLFGRGCVRIPTAPPAPEAGSEIAAAGGLGFFVPDGLTDTWHREHLKVTRSFREMVLAAARGDFDHFHSFIPCGPRAAWFDRTRVEGNDAVFAIGALQFEGPTTTREMRVAGIGVVGAAIAVEGVIGARAFAVPATGAAATDYARSEPDEAVRLGLEGERAALLHPMHPAESRSPLPHLWQTAEIRVRCDSPAAAEGLRAIAVVNATAPLVVSLVKELDEKWNFRTSVITEHAGYSFLNIHSYRFHSRNTLAATREESETACGWLIDLNEGPTRFSALPDEPGSFMPLFPALTHGCGIRFVNPGGLTGTPNNFYDATSVVLPTLVRNRSSLYTLRRMTPRPPADADSSDPIYERNRAPSFGQRLGTLFSLMEQHPSSIWPVYTHLGCYKPLDQPPDPYIAHEPMCELQDRVYGISGCVRPGRRVWFTRGTALAEHALLMQRIATQIERPDANTVIIHPWTDGMLEYPLPVSMNQTFGLTFRVADPALARVRIGDEPVEQLARFEHDDGNWVTLLPSSTREVVFEAVDPLSRPGTHAENLSARWDTADGIGTLNLDASGVHGGALMLDPAWIDPAGHQAFHYRVESHDDGGCCAWLVETADGGRFAWGDRRIIESLGPLTARRHERIPSDGLITVPFWDMTWADDAAPGGPLPTRAIRRLSLLVRGRVGVSAAAYLRPSPAKRDRPIDGTLVGGFVPADRAGDTVVHLEADGSTQQCRPDPCGCFLFRGIHAPAVRVWADGANGGGRSPRGGEWVESSWDRPGVVFE